MGLREAFQKAAQSGMAAIGNVKIAVIYRSVTDDPAYNPATGVVENFEIAYRVEMFFDKNLSEDLKNVSIDSNQKLGYIAQADLQPIPAINDKVTINFIHWNVIDVLTDPADALWILKIESQ